MRRLWLDRVILRGCDPRVDRGLHRGVQLLFHRAHPAQRGRPALACLPIRDNADLGSKRRHPLRILDPNAGRRTYVPLDKISPYVVAATIATEDKDFYIHPGFDFWAIVRALWENYRTGGQGGGASTITQQLARALLLSPEERAERTVQRKAREIILAAEITRRYAKDEILELYLNEIYYGNLAYGIEAAAETYFHTTADNLTLAQASFLAGLPQSPAIYDIYTNPDATLARHDRCWCCCTC